MSFVKDIRHDIDSIKARDPAAKSALEIVLTYSGVHAVIMHRVAHALYKRGFTVTARIVSQISRFFTGIEIHPGAKIGKGLLIDHGGGVVIGETAVVGDYCLLYQGCTLGGTGKECGKRHPTLGNGVMVGCGAKVLGPFKVGDGAKIAANAVVLSEVPAGATAVGVPARVVRMHGKAVPAAQEVDQIHIPDPVAAELKVYKKRLDELEKKLNRLSGEESEKKNDTIQFADKKKEEVVPNTPGKFSMYTCGPTVYHYAHIGNLRTYIMEDILEKYLRYTGLDVTRVMNITDVGHLTSDGDTGDDKMLKGAKREHKSVMEIAKFYTDAFFADCKKLNIKTPDVVEPATGCIDDFIRVISSLMEKGYAYEAGGNIYFDTSKLKEYYVFGDVSEEDLAVGVREGVEADDNKRNKADFVLWFTKSKFDDQELKWESPWGVGYPGWHIECSCISMKHVGEYLDLHCGGIDNQFPHHTNEIAQSEAYLGHKWCNYWFHVHHLNTTGGKMSKSKGEFLTVSLLEEKGYDPMVYRFFCLQSHYRRSLVFDWENLNNARGAYEKLVNRIAAVSKEDMGEDNAEKYSSLLNAFDAALGNDLNTAQAVTVLYNVLKANISRAQKLTLIGQFDKVLGLDLIKHAEAKLKAEQEAESDIPDEIKQLVEQRAAARKAKDFAAADALRDRITSMGWVIEETRQGTKVHKK